MINKKTTPILSIAIPTFNRSYFLKLNLGQLKNEIKSCPYGTIELLVSDNASEDDTQFTVEYFQNSGMSINYIKNDENIGSDANIAQCFNMAKGQYVLILGDDDLLVDGALVSIVKHLKNQQYGVVFLKSYGYDNDFRKESPEKLGGGYKVYNDSDKFLEKVAHYITLISGCILNKEVLENINATQFCGSNLVQVDLALSAALRVRKNLFISSYSVACKRNNSGGYDFTSVFVVNFFNILDSYKTKGLGVSAINNIENYMIISFFPHYLLKHRRNSNKSMRNEFNIFNERFGNKLLFKIYLMPILLWPRFMAIAWGWLAVLIARIYKGDFYRGVKFLTEKSRSCLFENKVKF